MHHHHQPVLNSLTTYLVHDMTTNKQFDVAGLEVVHDAVAVILVNAAVDGHTAVRMSHQVLHQLIGMFLFVYKHKDTALLLVQAKQLQQLQELLTILQDNLNTRTGQTGQLIESQCFILKT